MDGEQIKATDLIHRLLPLAREGLVDHDVDAEEADRLLGVIRERATTGRLRP